MKINKLIFLLATLNEFYILNLGRIFDFVIYFLTFLIFIFQAKKLKINQALFPLLIIYFILGSVINSQFRLSFALIMGLFLFIAFDYEAITKSFFFKVLSLHICFFLLQILLFYLFNYHLSIADFFSRYLDTSRNLNSDLNFYRPSGLYLEPNAFCVNILFLLIIGNKFIKDKHIYVSALVMILSLSLFGIASGIMIAFYTYFIDKRKLSLKKLSIGFFILTGFLILFIKYIDYENTITYGRILSISEGNDASYDARFNSGETSLSDFIFPKFLDFELYHTATGINMFSVIIYSLGFLGIILLSYMTKKSLKDRKTFFMLLVFFSYPYIAYSILFVAFKSYYTQNKNNDRYNNALLRKAFVNGKSSK